MKLVTAANRFNKTRFADAYTPATQFTARLEAYDDGTRDSLSVERRVLITNPDQVIPDRGAIQAGQTVWLVGNKSDDFHGEGQLRSKYILHRADGLAQVKSFSEVLSNTTGLESWASILWVKEDHELSESSALYGAYNIYFGQNEDIRDPTWNSAVFNDGSEYNVMVFIKNRWLLVRGTYLSGGGFLVAVADELPSPVVLNASFTTNVYNILTETSAPTTTTRKIINLRWQVNFTYLHEYAENYLAGDTQVITLKSGITPDTSTLVTVNGRDYRVVAVFDQAPCWSLHLRRV